MTQTQIHWCIQLLTSGPGKVTFNALPLTLTERDTQVRSGQRQLHLTARKGRIKSVSLIILTRDTKGKPALKD